jgi:CrcB protein
MASTSNASFWQEIRSRAILYGFVALGSVIGGGARYLVSIFLQLPFVPGFPWATLFINVTGSFVIGFYAALTGPDGRVFASTRQRQFVTTGICGGYTTFSAFSLESFQLVRTDHALTALSYIGISVIGWLVAVWLGHALATRINRLKGT